jgi:acyl-CoA reductase-like NAD-dependent aldehyde dehydrogenase
MLLLRLQQNQSKPIKMGSLQATSKLDIFSGFYNTINGKLTSTEKTRHGINPATGKPNPEIPVSTQQDVDNTVAAARDAFKIWSKTPWHERKKAVLDFADALEQHTDDFAKMLTQEQSKPVCTSLEYMLPTSLTNMI